MENDGKRSSHPLRAFRPSVSNAASRGSRYNSIQRTLFTFHHSVVLLRDVKIDRASQLLRHVAL